MIKVKYSTSYDAKRKRIKRLPEYYIRLLEALIKKDALGVIKAFQEGIRNKTFNMRPLQEKTIKRKISKGMPKPDTPLYGWGDMEEKSYINMLRLRRYQTGNKIMWKVRPSKAMHHSKKIRLDWLFDVHEYGTIIMQWRGGNLVIIRIPPRPALFLAYRRYLIKKRREEPAKDVQKAITRIINDGNFRLEQRIREKAEKGLTRDLYEI